MSIGANVRRIKIAFSFKYLHKSWIKNLKFYVNGTLESNLLDLMLLIEYNKELISNMSQGIIIETF